MNVNCKCKCSLWEVQCLLWNVISSRHPCRRRQHYHLPTRTTFHLGMWAPGLEYPAQCANCVWHDAVMISQHFECVLAFSLKWVQRDRLLVVRYVGANQLITCLDPQHHLKFLTRIHLNQSFFRFPQIRFTNFMSFESLAWFGALFVTGQSSVVALDFEEHEKGISTGWKRRQQRPTERQER